MANFRKSLCLLLALGLMSAYGQGSLRLEAKQAATKAGDAKAETAGTT